MRREFLAALCLAPLLAACATKSEGPAKAASASTATARGPSRVPATRAPVRRPPPPPVRPAAVPGLEGVIGATAADLVRQFGAARLDVIEGDARKLQWIGPACVLDIYLYPGAQGREPQASYVEARRASDGQDVDRIACVSAMRSTPAPPPRP